MRDNPIVSCRIIVFCAYPTLVYFFGALERFVVALSASYAASVADFYLSAMVSFMYPFAAVVNVLLFLYTEELMGWIFSTCCRRCCRCSHRGQDAPALGPDLHFDSDSDVGRDQLVSERIESNSVVTTTGFCAVVRAIACATVTGLAPGTAPYRGAASMAAVVQQSRGHFVGPISIGELAADPKAVQAVHCSKNALVYVPPSIESARTMNCL
ncbi:uncharacterized protein Tco025E_05100 [Trypanosoma conorhini]|uniref:Uncharacterized protein n=1 Tax=Trypanosoma conorhini TaxID=83891 RepID=A0A422PG93_9TRYP|nr:uncharacterized protein Tco025E_05100 [Trypanosoma conorhini]RNF16721.1 hypothetical protein Tco025E_05100 [Trypanosoma conorhini]